MLGRLTRWLRMLGFDTQYAGGHEGIPDDRELLVQAAREGRLLVTQDKLLGQNPGFCLLVSGEVEEQLMELVRTLDGPFQKVADQGISRCSMCNGNLDELLAPALDDELSNRVTTSKSERRELPVQVWEALPQAVRASQQIFWRCVDCGQVYWKGSHWVKIDRVRRLLIDGP